MKTTNVNLRLTPNEKMILITLAAEDYCSQNSVMRRLLAQEARRRDLLPRNPSDYRPNSQTSMETTS